MSSCLFLFSYPSFRPLIEGQVMNMCVCVCVCVCQCVRCNHRALLLSNVDPDSFPPTRNLIGRQIQPIRARHQGALKLSFPPLLETSFDKYVPRMFSKILTDFVPPGKKPQRQFEQRMKSVKTNKLFNNVIIF